MLHRIRTKIFKSHKKEIYSSNLVVSSTVSVLVFCFLYLLSPGDLSTTILSSTLAFFFMVSCSYILYKIYLLCTIYFSSSLIKFSIIRFLLSYCAGFLVFIIHYFGTSLLIGYPRDLLFHGSTLPIFTAMSIVFTTLIITFHNLVIVQSERNNAKVENANLKTKSAEAANLFLKQQIHPHFLFNSLSTLKVLYKQDIGQGNQYLVLLADFMRNSISSSTAVTTTVKEELNIFEQYLQLQKMRFGDSLKWEIHIGEELIYQRQIPSFSLQPLAENAIKHNNFSIKQPLIIKIQQSNGMLFVLNSMNKKKYSDFSTGTGLSNLSERYKIWSGEELQINNDGNIFSVGFLLKN